MLQGLPYLKERGFINSPTLEKHLYELIKQIPEPDMYSLIHRDLQPQNINWNLKTNKITGVFDFETVMAGDFLYEFSLLELNLFRHYPGIKNSFYRTYNTKKQLPVNYQSRVNLYVLLQLIYFHMRNIQKGEEDRAINNFKRIAGIVKGI